MSAYVVDKATIDDITSAALHYGLLDVDTATLAGQMLWDANRRAVAQRYGEFPAEIEYRFEATPAHVGQWARSLTNLVYQCSSHPTWGVMQARELCVKLAVAMLTEIPGYHEAEVR